MGMGMEGAHFPNDRHRRERVSCYREHIFVYYILFSVAGLGIVE